jgi:Zn-dependent protease/CBS domain-containing protein
MRPFRIGTVFGVELRVDWSWVFIFVLLTWNLVDVFSRWHPGWSALEALAVAGSASVIFFGCVVVHELAHSAVAMRYGLRVRSITLFLFGGVSNIEREPPSAGAEFFTAIVGPITSILLGVGCLALTSAAMAVSMTASQSTWTDLARLGPLGTLLAWLGPINIMIGLFNLIPAFPLDGGRVLRSVLWKATGDLRTATLAASATGQAIGWLLIAGGIAMTFGARLPYFGTGLASGLWLAFIGWFVHGAAGRAATHVVLDDALAGMTVEQLMQRHGPVATPELSVAALVHEHLLSGDDRGLPVVRDGLLVGLVSISDVRTLPPARWADTSVGAIMRAADTLEVTTPAAPLAKAFEQLAKRDIDQLPVVVNGTLVGMLRRRDVTRWIELAWRPSSARPMNAEVPGRSVSRSDRPRQGAGTLIAAKDVRHAH